MQEENINNNNFEDEIDLRKLFNILLNGKWIIVSITSFASIIGVIYSLLLPNIYESKALLVPVNASSGISGALRSYSSLAGLAGISLPPSNDESNSFKAIEKIKSLSFFENNILENINLPDLLAVESWDIRTSTIVYDESIYDASTKVWFKDGPIQQQIPSAQKSFGVFITKHLSLSVDMKSGFVTISIKHQSPIIAKQWTELVVNEINSFYRQKDKIESERVANYLNQQISSTGLSEIKEVLAQLLQEETKKLSLIEAKEYYVFDFIDPPAVMENKSEPNRAIICILSAIFGGMLGILLVLMRSYFFSEKKL